MKNVYLIGDSIMFGANGKDCRGYGEQVRTKLAGRASVAWPHENCRFAEYTLRYLHEWASEVDGEKIDVVHWNNGLWDVLRLFGDEPLTPVDVYVSMLKRVYARIRRMFPNAKVIFALNTPVIEELASPDFFRYNHEIDQYNEAAKACMQELGVPVNDLNAVVRGLGREYRADFVHFNSLGSDLLSDAVIGALEQYS